MNSLNRVREEQQIKVTNGQNDLERAQSLPMTPEAPLSPVARCFRRRRNGDLLRRLGEVMMKAEITAAEDYSINHL